MSGSSCSPPPNSSSSHCWRRGRKPPWLARTHRPHTTKPKPCESRAPNAVRNAPHTTTLCLAPRGGGGYGARDPAGRHGSQRSGTVPAACCGISAPCTHMETSKSRQSLPHVTATPAHACLSPPTAPCRPKEPSKVTEPEGHTHPALQPAQAERQHTLTPLALALTRHEPLHTRHCTSPCLPNELSSASAHTAFQTALPQPHHETPQPLHDPTTTLGSASKGKPKRAKGVSHVRGRLPLALASLRITLPPPPDRSAVTAPPPTKTVMQEARTSNALPLCFQPSSPEA